MWFYIPSNSAPASACLAKACAPHASYSASSTAPFATWSGKPLQPRNLPGLWKREPLIRRLSGLTCLPSTAQRGADAWISSLRASRARTSALPGGVLGLMASARACSSTSSTLPTLARREASFWRTSQPSLLPPPPLWTKPKGFSKNAPPPASWENWPTAGGTRNGSLFLRPTLAPATGAHGGSASPGGGRWDTPDCMPEAPNTGSNRKAQPAGLGNQARMVTAGTWPTPDTGRERTNRSASPGAADRPTIAPAAKLWATPNAHDGRRPGADLKSTQGGNLNRDAVMWMTPTTQSAKGVDYQRVKGKNVLILDGQAKALMEQWPTPRATDGTKGGPNQAGSKGDLMLPSAAAQWPTPASRDYRTPNRQSLQDRGQGSKGEQLPNFVEHHFSHPVLSTLDGRPLSPTDRTLPRRLNPAFACWLMGWPIWWTNPALTSCVRLEMASYRCRLQLHLSSLCGVLLQADA